MIKKKGVVANNKMKIKTKAKGKHAVNQGSAADAKVEMDLHNAKGQIKGKAKRKVGLRGHNSAKQNGGSESKLNKGTKKKNWIAGAIKKPGALHAELGVKQGNKIPAGKLAAAAKKPGTEGRRARLAETLKGLKGKKKGMGMSAGAKAYLKRVGGKC